MCEYRFSLPFNLIRGRSSMEEQLDSIPYDEGLNPSGSIKQKGGDVKKPN